MSLLTLVVGLLLWCKPSSADTENDARKYLQRVNELYAEKNYQLTLAEWDYANNITEENLVKKVIFYVFSIGIGNNSRLGRHNLFL